MDDILSKKEFYRYKTLDYDFKNFIDHDPRLTNHFQLRAHQQFVRDFMNPSTSNKRLHLEHMTGMGKCHGYGTTIRMYSGSVKEVQDIVPGDLLLGDDWRPRVVTSLARGVDQMVMVMPNGEEAFTCNEDHILSLVRNGKLFDLSIKEYWMLDDNHQYLLYKTAAGGIITSTFNFVIKRIGIGNYYGFTLDGNSRYTLANGIITHNTLSALAIAGAFITTYKSIYSDLHKKEKSIRALSDLVPTIYVIAFAGARKSFITEMLSRPSLGYISHDELAELKLLRSRRETGGLSADEEYKKFNRQLKRRLQSKHLGGYFKFYGYEEFVNQLFYGSVTLTELEKEAYARLAADPDATFDIVAEYVASGRLSVNTRLLNNMTGSLIIADEIHETYNSDMKNNRGLALQYILDIVPDVRFLSLSATPINNSPTEVIDLMNYLLPQKIRKKDFFTQSREISDRKLNELGALSRGLFSFIRDRNIVYYPKRIIHGEVITIPRTIGNVSGELPYLKFIKCPMSELHQKTYIEYITTDDTPNSTVSAESPRSISVAGYTILDMILPGNPPVFLSSDKKSADVVINRRSDGTSTISGDFLKRENIGKYSQKYLQLLQQLDEIIAISGGEPTKSGKCIIYHNTVEMSGVLMIQELLTANGYLDERREPVDSTKCMVCGKLKKEHTTCPFYPARFATIYGARDPASMERTLANYDDPNNDHGHKIFIIIGSKIIRQSLDFKCVQHLIIASLPVNISTLIQVFGRCIRTKSHIRLPPEQHVVNIYILISTINKQFPYLDEVSPEVNRYATKLSDYLVIQKIEQKINENAIDADIHSDVIWPMGEEPADLGPLYYKPVRTIKYDGDDTTFFAYGYADAEIDEIVRIIKYLFYVQPVWTYDDLWKKVRKPDIHLEMNPELFSESSFAIAMTKLTREWQNINKLCDKCSVKTIDPEFTKAGMLYRIRMVGEYFVAFPVTQLTRAFDPDKRNFDKHVNNNITYTYVDAETYLRPIIKVQKVRSMLTYVPPYAARYDADLQAYIRKGKYKEIITNTSVDFQRHFLEQYIIWRRKLDDSIYADTFLTKTFKYMSLFGMVVFLKDVKKREDIYKRIRDRESLLDETSLPVGFETARSARIYDGTTWLDISKNDLGLNIQYRENDIVVGILEPMGSNIVFKLRNPVHVIQEKYDALKAMRHKSHENTRKRSESIRLSMGDYRSVERGMTCTTKYKDDVLRIAAALGISISTLPKNALRTGTLCNLIMQTLIDNELGERSQKSARKYIYGWWNPEQRAQHIVN